LGYRTLGDLARAGPLALESVFGRRGQTVARLAGGDDRRDVEAGGQGRSIGAEETYDQDLVGFEAIGRTLLAHSSRVARRLTNANASARTVAIKIKYSDFDVRTRAITLAQAVRDTDTLYAAAIELLARIPLQGRRVRLTGVSVRAIAWGPPPRMLVPDPQAQRRQRIEEVAAQIVDRYRDDRAVTRATLLGRIR
jgi:DNA polymerase-4